MKTILIFADLKNKLSFPKSRLTSRYHLGFILLLGLKVSNIFFTIKPC